MTCEQIISWDLPQGLPNLGPLGKSSTPKVPAGKRRIMGVEPKIAGLKTPKMDGLFHGKPYWNGWFGGPTPIFGNTLMVVPRRFDFLNWDGLWHCWTIGPFAFCLHTCDSAIVLRTNWRGEKGMWRNSKRIFEKRHATSICMCLVSACFVSYCSVWTNAGGRSHRYQVLSRNEASGGHYIYLLCQNKNTNSTTCSDRFPIKSHVWKVVSLRGWWLDMIIPIWSAHYKTHGINIVLPPRELQLTSMI